MISVFKNIRNPKPVEEIDVYEFLERVKYPDSETLKVIQKARDYKSKGETQLYDRTKAELPCFTLNFNFSGRKNNANIKQPSGFIYLDVDDQTSIDLTNPLIFASWISLSKDGRGILVKVDGLSLKNFSSNYEVISKSLQIKTDKFAAKATQYTVHSFDVGLYLNEDSVTWKAGRRDLITPTSIILKGGKEEDTVEVGEIDKLKFNNIQDIDFEDKKYVAFPNEKESIAVAYIPKTINRGQRNNVIYAFTTQLRALNPDLSSNRFTKFILIINITHCKPPMNEAEVIRIINKVLASDDLEPYKNTPRRVIFNPECKLDKREKSIISNGINGKRRSAETLEGLKCIVKDWDIKSCGKVTQKKLAELSGRNIKTVEKYYKQMREDIYKVNKIVS